MIRFSFKLYVFCLDYTFFSNVHISVINFTPSLVALLVASSQNVVLIKPFIKVSSLWLVL